MFTFSPFRQLIYAARMLLPSQNHDSTRASVVENLRGLATALEAVEVAHVQVQQSADYIAFAREAYGSDECEIDEEPMVSMGVGGRWVSAWVWVSDADATEEAAPFDLERLRAKALEAARASARIWIPDIQVEAFEAGWRWRDVAADDGWVVGYDSERAAWEGVLRVYTDETLPTNYQH